MRHSKAFLIIVLALATLWLGVLPFAANIHEGYHFGCSSVASEEYKIFLGFRMCRAPVQPQNQAGAASEPSPGAVPPAEREAEEPGGVNRYLGE